jgi:hypothetical protein
MPWFPISEVRELETPATGTRRSLLTSGVADETLPARDDHCLETGMDAERLQQVPNVIAHRLRRQMQVGCDLFGRRGLREQLENLLLAPRQVRPDHTRRLRLEPGNCKDRTIGIIAGNRHGADHGSHVSTVKRDDIDLVVGEGRTVVLALELSVGVRGMFRDDGGPQGDLTHEIAEQRARRVVHPGNPSLTAHDHARESEMVERCCQVDAVLVFGGHSLYASHATAV